MATDFVTLFNDPLLLAMASGEYLWGDLMYDTTPPRSPTTEVEVTYDLPAEMPEDWDLEFPSLRLRKDIWENFPVTVAPLGAGPDGAERHAIAWHRKNFEEWRNERTEDGYEALNYRDITEYRLFKCLNASKYWAVEDPLTDDMICVIRMNFVPRDDATIVPAVVETSPSAGAGTEEDDGWTTVGATKALVAAAAPTRPPPRSDVPLLTRLNDIKEYFPVVWHKDESYTRTAVYAVEIFGKKITEMARTTKRSSDDVRADVERRLTAALRASHAWRVLPAVGKEFVRLEMA